MIVHAALAIVGDSPRSKRGMLTSPRVFPLQIYLSLMYIWNLLGELFVE